jgi:hypothetical protein
VLRDPAILAENVYEIDETAAMLCILGTVGVLVSQGNKRKHRDARVERTTVTAVKCIRAGGGYLNPMAIWPATTFPTPGWHYACKGSMFTDSNISLQWLKRLFYPETTNCASGIPRALILDGFGTHGTFETWSILLHHPMSIPLSHIPQTSTLRCCCIWSTEDHLQ